MLFQKLPLELLLPVLATLSPADIIRLRRVSPAWHAALSSPVLCRLLLRTHFPHCREAARLYRQDDGDSNEDGNEDEEDEPDWAAAFVTVARRYHNLCRGRPHRVEHITDVARVHVCTTEDDSLFNIHAQQGFWHPVHGLHGHRHRSALYMDPFSAHQRAWSLDAAHSLLVYGVHVPPPAVRRARQPHSREPCAPLRLRDLVAGTTQVVPFNVAGGHCRIRQLRLAGGLLAVEWFGAAEPRDVAWQTLYVTLFDVRETVTNGETVTETAWSVRPRGTLALPWGITDACFSLHSRTHYALYRSYSMPLRTHQSLLLAPLPSERESETPETPETPEGLSIFQVTPTMPPLQRLGPWQHHYKTLLDRIGLGHTSLLSALLDDQYLYVLQEVQPNISGVTRAVRLVKVPLRETDQTDQTGHTDEADQIGQTGPAGPAGPALPWQGTCQGAWCSGACRLWHEAVRRSHVTGHPSRSGAPWPARAQHQPSPGYWPLNAAPLRVVAEVADLPAGVAFAAVCIDAHRHRHAPATAAVRSLAPVLQVAIAAGVCDSTLAAYREELQRRAREDTGTAGMAGMAGMAGGHVLETRETETETVTETTDAWMEDLSRHGRLLSAADEAAAASGWLGRLDQTLLPVLAGGMLVKREHGWAGTAAAAETDAQGRLRMEGRVALDGDERFVIGTNNEGRLTIVWF